MAVYQALLLNTVVPQIQAAQAGDSYVMVVNATTPALRITQTGTGNALEVEDAANPDATPFVVTAAGDVGIGTNAPAVKLHVSGAGSTEMRVTNSTASLNAVMAAGTSSMDFGTNTNHRIDFYTNSSLRATLDTSGNLGLGVTPSAWGSISRAMQFQNGVSIFSNTSGLGGLGNNVYSNPGTGDYYIATGFATRYYQYNGTHVWNTAASGTAGATTSITSGVAYSVTTLGSTTLGEWQAFFSALTGIPSIGQTVTATATGTLAGGATVTQIAVFTQAMTLDASGNLGVGETSPSTFGKLVVKSGTISLVTDTASQRRLSFYSTANGNSENAYIQVQNDGATTNTGEMLFATKNTGGTLAERARITSGGNFLVGTDNAAENAGLGMKVLNTGGTVALVSAASDSSQQGFEMYSTGAAAYRLYVNYAGTINATNTTISAISDQRLKENIQDLDVGLNAVMALKPRKFDWKAGKGKDIKGDRGWIAQEFEQVFPDMIDTWRDPAPEGEEPYKAVRADLIPVLVKAIQELKAEVDSLKAQLEAK